MANLFLAGRERVSSSNHLLDHSDYLPRKSVFLAALTLVSSALLRLHGEYLPRRPESSFFLAGRNLLLIHGELLLMKSLFLAVRNSVMFHVEYLDRKNIVLAVQNISFFMANLFLAGRQRVWASQIVIGFFFMATLLQGTNSYSQF